MKTLLLLLVVVVVLPCCTNDQRTKAFDAGLQGSTAALHAYSTGGNPKLAAAGAALNALTPSK